MNSWPIGYKKSKQKAQNIYKKIGTVQCPALNNNEVSFNRKGFNHLVRKGRIPRPRNEQKRRFRLIPYLESIVTDSDAKIHYDESLVEEIVNRRGEKVLRKSMGHFWKFKAKVDDCQIKVTIRQLNNGKKHFFSVWGDNVRIK